MKRWIMVMGSAGSGKTSLCRRLEGSVTPLRKTQDMIFGRYTIDVPGSYLDNPWMNRHLITVAQNYASQIVMLLHADGLRQPYSPGFAKVFRCPVTGVITGCGPEDPAASDCEEQLKKAGIRYPIFYIRHSGDLEGIRRLGERLGIHTVDDPKTEGGTEDVMESFFAEVKTDGGENEIYNRK